MARMPCPITFPVNSINFQLIFHEKLGFPLFLRWNLYLLPETILAIVSPIIEVGSSTPVHKENALAP